MSVLDMSTGSPIGDPNPSTPPSPVQELRAAIGRMADCQTRMLDQLAGDVFEDHSLPYLHKQMDHIATAFVDAYKTIQAAELLAEAAKPEFLDGFTEVEIVHLGLGLVRGEAKGGDA